MSTHIEPTASPSPSPRDTEEHQTEVVAAKSGFPYYDSRELEAIASLPEIDLATMRKYMVAPLHRYNELDVELGLTAKTDITRLPELQKLAPSVKFTFKTISSSGYEHILSKIYYNAFQPERDGNFTRFGKKLAAAAPKDAFSLIAQLAYWLGASDIHIEPQANGARVRFRLDGILHPITTVATDSYKIFLSDLQTRAEITWGSDTPQSGRISFNLMNNQAQMGTVNMRIETLPTFHGEEIVVRLFNDESRNLKLSEMGFNELQVERIKTVTAHPNGMVLTVGPTGSGKTSTLYAIINGLNSPDTKIVTLEDPVEYDLPGISQIPVKTEDKELFAEKLRAVMREDPNVVMIGEIRDIDTAKTALQASLTGHLVLSTFHATNAAAAVSRMLDMIGQNPLFASAIRMIIAQRLARRVCPDCTEKYEPSKDEMELIKKIVGEIPAERRPTLPTDLKLIRGTGCAACHGLGYKGRIAIVEMMLVTPDIEQLMTTPTKTTSQDVEAAAIKNGMSTLQEDGLHKALSGMTTISEVERLGED
jgi:type IV pilus assembly protein PilB